MILNEYQLSHIYIYIALLYVVRPKSFIIIFGEFWWSTMDWIILQIFNLNLAAISCGFFLSEKNSIWIEPTILLQTYC